MFQCCTRIRNGRTGSVSRVGVSTSMCVCVGAGVSVQVFDYTYITVSVLIHLSPRYTVVFFFIQDLNGPLTLLRKKPRLHKNCRKKLEGMYTFVSVSSHLYSWVTVNKLKHQCYVSAALLSLSFHGSVPQNNTPQGHRSSSEKGQWRNLQQPPPHSESSMEFYTHCSHC